MPGSIFLANPKDSKNHRICFRNIYLRLLVFSAAPFDMRKSSNPAIRRNEDRYSLNATPFGAEDDLLGTTDWTTLNSDVCIWLYSRLSTVKSTYKHAQNTA